MFLLLSENSFFNFNHGVFGEISLLELRITRKRSDQSFAKRNAMFSEMRVTGSDVMVQREGNKSQAERRNRKVAVQKLPFQFSS